MLIIAVLFIIVVTALFGAVAFSKWRNNAKEVNVFECGLPKIEKAHEKNAPSVQSVALFLVIEAICILVLLASQLDFEVLADNLMYLLVISMTFGVWFYCSRV